MLVFPSLVLGCLVNVCLFYRPSSIACIAVFSKEGKNLSGPADEALVRNLVTNLPIATWQIRKIPTKARR